VTGLQGGVGLDPLGADVLYKTPKRDGMREVERVAARTQEMIRDNRAEIEGHPLSRRIHLIQGSSTDPNVLRQVRERVADRGPVLVILDSDHTHAHVLRELELYSPLVGSGSYVVVMDTSVEFLPDKFHADRAWGKGNNPMSAVHAFLKNNDRFVIDESIHDKLLITVAYDGYLKCVKD
jgi:cephalosporin hydroxylase